MKTTALFLLSALALTSLASGPGKAQSNVSPVSFRIILNHDGNLLSSSANDSIVWELWVETQGIRVYSNETFEERVTRYGITDEFIENSKQENAPFIEHNQGSTYFTYTTNKAGLHHIEAYNKYTGELVGYTVLMLDSFFTLPHYSGKKVEWPLILERGGKLNAWSPFTNNTYSGRFKLGVQ